MASVHLYPEFTLIEFLLVKLANGDEHSSIRHGWE